MGSNMMCYQTITARYKAIFTHPQFCPKGELQVQGQMSLYTCTVVHRREVHTQ